MDEIKYERKIIHRVVVFMRIMMGTVAISKLNEIILVMYYFVYIGNGRTQQLKKEHYTSS